MCRNISNEFWIGSVNPVYNNKLTFNFLLFTNVKLGLFTFVNMEKERIDKSFFKLYTTFKNADLEGRYLCYDDIEPHLDKLKKEFKVEEIGRSFLNVPIKSIEIGNGPIKVLGWSQMHGNETTTTKGLFDLFNLFRSKKKYFNVDQLLNQFTLLFIPMLNPDGAARYTRENVNNVDLNRDANNLLEPESRVLRTCFESFQPDYCLNLHDQRSIFGAGDAKKPATLSFLAPSLDEERSITPERERAMKIIAAMNEALQDYIPGQIGRFDDAFNINCTGDTFQSLRVPTILFECGHYQEDYQREKTREYFTFSMLVALENIASGDFARFDVKDYEGIPQNKKNFFDVILRNGIVRGQNVDVAIQFSEQTKAGKIIFTPVIQTMAPSLSFYGHKEIDCYGQQLLSLTGAELNENDIVQLILLNHEKLLIKS